MLDYKVRQPFHIYNMHCVNPLGISMQTAPADGYFLITWLLASVTDQSSVVKVPG